MYLKILAFERSLTVSKQEEQKLPKIARAKRCEMREAVRTH